MNRDDQNAEFLKKLEYSMREQTATEETRPHWTKLRDAAIDGTLEDFDDLLARERAWDGTDRRGDLRLRKRVAAGQLDAHEARNSYRPTEIIETDRPYFIDPSGSVHLERPDWDMDGFYDNGE